MHKQFPKAKLSIERDYNVIIPLLEPYAFAQITSLDLSRPWMEPERPYTYNSLKVDLTQMPNLTHLTVNPHIKPEILALTKIPSIKFPSNYPVTKRLLTQLTDLRELNLDPNLSSDDLSSLPITSLSLNGETPLSLETFRSLKLTELTTSSENLNLLADEIIQTKYTILTTLALTLREHHPIWFKPISKMTCLKKLTLDCAESFPDEKCLINLTNLTYLRIYTDVDSVHIPHLPRLETFILYRYRLLLQDIPLEFPSCPLDNLTHLKIIGYKIKLKNHLVPNLTSLDYNQHEPSESKLSELKRLTKLTIINNEAKSKLIDITSLNSLVSLVIGGGYYHSCPMSHANIMFAQGSDNIVNHTLETLTITGNEIRGINDHLLVGFPNLRVVSLRCCVPELTSSCFERLPNLSLLKIHPSNTLDTKSISLLRARGVIIKYCL
ncbi:MAG: hypothetical protein Harvfovirus29_9 [Harvfovirus sp.]|uniref:Leucine-rich repeat protein n=1 Tax=Harvfovirus sp. TaxID=2487768 RepID=A0A3G5A2K1_9VIRU|nr:MAG: hypothetical protein Harvfovirus29_9 [Harvfovirus sp.]